MGRSTAVSPSPLSPRARSPARGCGYGTWPQSSCRRWLPTSWRSRTSPDAQNLLPNNLSYTADDYAKITAYFNMPQYAVAAMLTTWAAVAGGRFAAAALLRYDQDEGHPGRHTTRAGRLLTFTAAVGLAIAACSDYSPTPYSAAHPTCPPTSSPRPRPPPHPPHSSRSP
ncbi:hypothetical protein ACFQZ4_02655 [Catellatospora coxensis]